MNGSSSGFLFSGRFLSVARRTHPLDPGHIGIDLPELDAVEAVLRLAARRRAERDVADLDVQHELQTLLAERRGGIDELQSGLGRERLLGRVDLHDLREAVHADDGAGGRGARRERVVAAHRADRTRILRSIAQDLLQFLERSSDERAAAES